MKRLSALFAALVILGVCTSSYGYFLIYNLTGSLKGTEGTVDIKKDTTDFKGYLVLDINNDTNELADANMFIYGRDPNNHKVYVRLNASDSNEFLDASILYRDKRNFYELNGKPPFDFRIVVMGQVNRTDIGLKHAKEIAPSLGGVITNEEGMLLKPGQELTGTGNISATLYGVATRGVNDPNNNVAPHTPYGIIYTLKEILAKEKHCTEVNVPAP
jgi:hypothetical protein